MECHFPCVDFGYLHRECQFRPCRSNSMLKEWIFKMWSSRLHPLEQSSMHRDWNSTSWLWRLRFYTWCAKYDAWNLCCIFYKAKVYYCNTSFHVWSATHGRPCSMLVVWKSTHWDPGIFFEALCSIQGSWRFCMWSIRFLALGLSFMFEDWYSIQKVPDSMSWRPGFINWTEINYVNEWWGNVHA